MQTIADNPCLSKIIADYYNYSCDEDGVWIGNKYVSIPYFSYGSEKAKEKIQSFKNWEYRGFEPISENYTCNKCSSYLYLKTTAEEQLEYFKPNLRRKIRKALKNNLIAKSGGIELLDDFYKVYYKNMKELGSPALPKLFFNAILSEYKNGNARIFIIYNDNQAIASAFLLSHHTFFENTWFASIRKYNHLYITYLLHWEMIRFSINQDAHIYSFGRSSIGGSVHQYKKQWDTTDFNLYWSYSDKKKLNIRKMKILAKIWKVLPDFITKNAGAFLAKKIY